jgi:hypothetical protein
MSDFNFPHHFETTLMQHTIHKIISCMLCGGLLLILPGCSKLLDQTDPSNFTAENYFTTPLQAQSSVNAIYASLSSIYSGGDGFGGGLSPWLMLEFSTGLANTELGEAVDNLNVRSLTNSSDNSEGLAWWVRSYKGIANANLAIAKIPGIAMDDAAKNKLLGQARFLRAFHYYNLVRIFGKVPLITTPVSLTSPDFFASQASVDSIYQAIVDDLTIAESSGLPATDASGRVSLGAVKSLLSSVYLTMAGYPLQKGTDYYQKASDKALEVIQSGNYSLFASYDQLHSPATNNQGEFIFQTQFTSLLSPSFWQQAIVPYNKGISVYDAQAGAIFAEGTFVNSFESGDKRAEEKQFFFTSYTLRSDRTVTIDLGNHYIYKLFDSLAQNSTASSGLNWTLMRYAEVLLIHAEASNELSGPSAAAYDAVNAIRQRAHLTNLSGLDQAQLRETIWREWWHELCYENKTWFNMVRLRKGYNVATGNFDDFVGHAFAYGPVLAEKDLLFPIPTSEIHNNKNLVQNPGY